MKKQKENANRNHVAQHSWELNKMQVHIDKKKESKKKKSQKHKGQDYE